MTALHVLGILGRYLAYYNTLFPNLCNDVASFNMKLKPFPDK